jgi:hypothetical protein
MPFLQPLIQFLVLQNSEVKWHSSRAVVVPVGNDINTAEGLRNLVKIVKLAKFCSVQAIQDLQDGAK